MKSVVLFCLLPFFNLSQRSFCCDPMNIAKAEKKFDKAAKKKKNYTLEYSELSFNIAECYRQKNDTTYLEWYKKNISACQNVMAKHNCDKENKYFPEVARLTAYSSYYIKDYKKAETFFQKLLTFNPVAEFHFMLGLTLIKLEKYPEAIAELNNFKVKGGNQTEAAELIKSCEEKSKK
jgi:tetratricopeptide (TPR) repeat protein